MTLPWKTKSRATRALLLLFWQRGARLLEIVHLYVEPFPLIV
jgi:hypothetical protein